MRYVPTVNDDSLKNGLSVSGMLHIIGFLLLYFGLPQLIKPLPSHHDPVPFEIVTVADITNTRTEQKPETPAPPAPPPQPQKAQAAPTPPAPPVKQPPAPQTPEPVKPVEAEALKPMPKPVEKPKPVQKAAPQPDLLSSVLKDVAKLKPAEQVKAPDTKTDVKTPATPAASQAPSLSNRLTISEEDALRRQIEQCWNFDPGARNAATLIVEVIMDVSPDKTVINTDIVDKSRYNSDFAFRAAADAAIRALRNPKCSPLMLPDGKYDEWKRIDFTFDPRDML